MTNPSTRARRTALGLVALLGGAGVAHFRSPEFFDAIVPPVMPGGARVWTYGSGVAELATAGLLAVPATRRLGGAAAAGLFVAVFPGNLQMAWDWRHRSAAWQALSIGRLPLQAVLVAWAEDVRRHG